MQNRHLLGIGSAVILVAYCVYSIQDGRKTGSKMDEVIFITDPNEDPAVTRYRQYLRCKAVHPDPDYETSIAWVKRQSLDLGLEYNYVGFGDATKFAIWLTWRGQNESLPSILLNSHMDVVPVDREKWTHDPFAAEKDPVTGNIYGRGTQDMKSVAVQYLEAIRRLKAKGVTPLRNVHLSFVPDEEKGGHKGMRLFVKSDQFKKLNVGFALDEARARPDDKFTLGWAERAAWHMEFTAEGSAGHGSIFHNNTAAEKIQKLVNLFLDLRSREKARMEANGLELGDVTSINLTMMKGGTQVNVVPSTMTVSMDVRITPHWKLSDMQTIIDNFTVQAGPGVTYRFLHKNDIVAQTKLTPDNVWWQAFQSVAKTTGFELAPVIHPGATDICYLRDIGIPAFGFSPMHKTPTLLHDHNEFLNEKIFLNGITVYENILMKIFNMPHSRV